MRRRIAGVGIGVLLLALGGCLINSPQEPGGGVYTFLRIQPDYNLDAAPDGWVYELSLLDVDSNFQPLAPIPLVRFQWDPENFRALDEDGNQIPLYSADGGPGMDMGINLLGHTMIALTLKPKGGSIGDGSEGPLVMFYLDPSTLFGFGPSLLETNLEAELRLDQPFGGILPQPGGPSVTLVAQSKQYGRQLGGEEVCWHDSTEGQGVWFAKTLVKDREINDTVAFSLEDPHTPGSGKGTRFTRKIPKIGDYHIWIFPDELEKSWSNFGGVFKGTAPDLRFRDGIPEHVEGETGPPTTGPNALGSHEWRRNGVLIGYLYFPDPADDPDFRDTCFLRIDKPESTYCTTETVKDSNLFAPIIDTNFIIRTTVITWGDTSVTPSLAGIPILNSAQTNLEYESWLIFDSSNNPTYPPLSLGRFRGDVDITDPRDFTGVPSGAEKRDSKNPYTDVANFDPNFHFPGEDLLSGLPNGLPSPLNVLDPSSFGVEKVKLWITIEPLEAVDFAPDKPNKQFIAYAANLTVPDDSLQAYQEMCGNRGPDQTQAPPTLNIPLLYRPISTSSTELTEGHNWPSIRIFLSNAASATKSKK